MQARSGYNHESKGLKKEQMEELKYPFFLFFSPPPETALVHCTVASKVSLRCRMFFVCVCGLLLIFTSSCFRAKLLLRRRCCRIREERFDFYWCRSSVCLFVTAGENLLCNSNFDVSCRTEQTVLKEGQVLCSMDFFT